MATQARRWMWLVNVLTILAGAWLLAGTANAIIANQLGATSQAPAKRPVVMGGSPSNAQTTKNVDYYLGPIKQKNVFMHGDPIPDEEIVGGPVTDSGPADGCTLSVQILASVVVPKSPNLSLVTVMDNTSQPPVIAVIQVGERAIGIPEQAELVAVREEWDDPTLTAISIAEFKRDNGRIEICRSDSKPVAAGAVAMAPAGGAATPTGDSIKNLGGDKFEVAQAEIDAVMNGGLASMAQDVRIVPYFEGGVSKGFKLYSIKPGSLLSKVGLMNGDVISKVNGYDINSPEKALQIYGLLKNEKNVSVDLTRNGQNKSLSYTIR